MHLQIYMVGICAFVLAVLQLPYVQHSHFKIIVQITVLFYSLDYFMFLLFYVYATEKPEFMFIQLPDTLPGEPYSDDMHTSGSKKQEVNPTYVLIT